ncbi:MAG TPA: DNA-directed RNA polymerase subunit beta', partial [Anaerolineales bacterium]|nr:DNA-directed RNA polymerase subunit beta' [Anaerolineales bacterium]
AGMRGLMADPSGRIIPMPIRSNFREGLTAQEYFISTHGARKGLADTALRTADAGYLTRRLVDIAQDIIINEQDCGTHDGKIIRRSDDVAGQPLSGRIFSRLLAERVIDPKTGEVIAERDDVVNQEVARRIAASGVSEVKVRSPLTCELQHGICAKCYGLDLG